MTVADKVLVVLILVAIGALFRYQWTPPRQAHSVTITAPHMQQSFSLQHDQHLHISGAKGDSELEISDGAVRFLSSPCRHKICVRSGWHQRAGAVAACVPNRIS
ncbi:MAG: NusG domain II-containing protein, partial [Oceanococcus sp.]